MGTIFSLGLERTSPASLSMVEKQIKDDIEKDKMWKK